MVIVNKERISSPLEAGASLHAFNQLPPQLTIALEYVSERLSRRGLHLYLIVIRKEVQMPANYSVTQSPQSSSLSSSSSTSPVRSLFGTASDTIKSTLSHKSSIASITDSTSSSAPLSSTYYSPTPQCGTPQTSNWNSYDITLMHASTLTPKAEKILLHTVSKAEKRFSIGSGWLLFQPITNAVTCPATKDLIRRSLLQNNIIFSSEGLTLLGLDQIYIFKSQLHTYSRTLLPADLTAAVDELRRLILTQCGRRITKGYLMRAYSWLGVSLAALVDVNEGYKIAYGGEKRECGMDVHNADRKSPPLLKTSFDVEEVAKMKLVLNTNAQDRAASLRKDIGEAEVGENAKYSDNRLRVSREVIREDRGPHTRGARTPNGCEDITPVTKGEWRCLMVGDGWKEARTVPVLTC